MPRAIIIAGPNGAGKTTFAKEFLPREGACLQFVNADLIAAGISPFAPDTADVAAGRVMLARLEELAQRKENFAVETTLSGRWLLKQIRSWRQVGYFVDLYFIRLASPELSLQRVKQRVLKGGHFIPDHVVRRRFERGWALFQDPYCREVDRWSVYDNSGQQAVLVSKSHE